MKMKWQPFWISLAIFQMLFWCTSHSVIAAPRTEKQKKVDDAIVKALRYLALQQHNDGYWKLRGNSPSCAATSLAVMSFMAAGHVPDEGPYGDTITKGIRWVISKQSSQGLLAAGGSDRSMYAHGISTLMLAEVIGMMPKEDLKETKQALEKACRVILVAQNVIKSGYHAGGWRYTPSSHDSDLSVTGWQLLALRASKNVGCDVPKENIEAAVAYVKNCTRGSGFSYVPGQGGTPTLTGTGITCLEVCDQHHSEEVLSGARFLLRTPLRRTDRYFYYGAYYTSVGMFKVGGEYWKEYYPHLTDELLPLQNFDGSFRSNRLSVGEESGGPIYFTTMAILALGVEYKYLPIYQR